MPVEPFDDPTIDDEDGLVRFVPWDQIIFDENESCYRPTSAAFEMSSDDRCMSVDLERLLIEAEKEPTANLIHRPTGSGAVRFIAKAVREKDLVPFADPIEPENPFHGQVANLSEPGKITRGTKRYLSKNSNWLFNPRDE